MLIPTHTWWLRIASFNLVGSVSVYAWMGVFTSNEINGASRDFTSAPVVLDMPLKFQCEPRTNRHCPIVLHYGSHHIGPCADLDVAKKSVLGIGTAIEVEDDLVVIEFDIGENQPVASLSGKPIAGNHVKISFPGRVEEPVGLKRQALVAAWEGTHGKSLFRLQNADQLETGSCIELRPGERNVGRLDLLIAQIHGVTDRPVELFVIVPVLELMMI